MDNMFFIEAKCRKTKQTFYIRYDKAAGGVWCKTYGVKEKPVSTGGSLNRGNINISGARWGPQYKCPYCHNRSYVHCGNCGHYTCISEDSNDFLCAYCGHTGTISGTITGIDGTSGVGQG